MDLSASCAGGAVLLQWQNLNARYYIVSRSTAGKSVVLSSQNYTTQFRDTTANPGTLYQYEVVADFASDRTVTDTANFRVPTNCFREASIGLQPPVSNAEGIHLRWTNVGATTYNVERRSSIEPPFRTTTSTNSYNDKALLVSPVTYIVTATVDGRDYYGSANYSPPIIPVTPVDDSLDPFWTIFAVLLLFIVLILIIGMYARSKRVPVEVIEIE